MLNPVASGKNTGPTNDKVSRRELSKSADTEAVAEGEGETSSYLAEEYEQIVQVINDIGSYVAQTVRTKFDGVHADARMARDSILQLARQDLEQIQERNVAGINNLLEFNRELVLQRDKLQKVYTETRKGNADLAVKIKQTIRNHDEHVSNWTKARPRTLFGEKGEAFRKVGIEIPR